MYVLLVQFGGLDGHIQLFRGPDIKVIRNQIRTVAAGMGTPLSDINVLCSKTPKKEISK